MKKIKGFRRAFDITRARFLSRNGVAKWGCIGFLCSKGWTRRHATQAVETEV